MNRSFFYNFVVWLLLFRDCLYMLHSVYYPGTSVYNGLALRQMSIKCIGLSIIQ